MAHSSGDTVDHGGEGMDLTYGCGDEGSCLLHILVDQEVECGIQQFSPFLLLI